MNVKGFTSRLFMIRPANFGYNEETAINNVFQRKESNIGPAEISRKAIEVFDRAVSHLNAQGLHIDIWNDSISPVKSDAVFPNNWMTTHSDGSLITYPMFAPSRRHERDEEIIEFLASIYDIKRRYSFEQYERDGLFLEGTGSMVLDRANKIAYLSVSPRSDAELFRKFCLLRDYTPVIFSAVDKYQNPIYHTNVILSLGVDYALVAEDMIRDRDEMQSLRRSLESTNKRIITISPDQVANFAGNTLQMVDNNGEPLTVLSLTAMNSLDKSQLALLQSSSRLTYVDVSHMEHFSGGSIRCMIAENFLQPKV